MYGGFAGGGMIEQADALALPTRLASPIASGWATRSPQHLSRARISSQPDTVFRLEEGSSIGPRVAACCGQLS